MFGPQKLRRSHQNLVKQAAAACTGDIHVDTGCSSRKKCFPFHTMDTQNIVVMIIIFPKMTPFQGNATFPTYPIHSRRLAQTCLTLTHKIHGILRGAETPCHQRIFSDRAQPPVDDPDTTSPYFFQVSIFSPRFHT